MDIHNLSQHDSLVSQYVSEVRDKNYQTNRLLFRNNIKRLGQIIAYEISKHLHYADTLTPTPLAMAQSRTLSDNVVLATMLRAGIPFHDGLLSYYDNAENAFLSAYRKPHLHDNGFDVIIDYMASPLLDGKTLIIVDPMLATGITLKLAYEALLSKGEPAHIHVASVIASQAGIDYIKSNFPEDKTTVWSCAIDPILNEYSYIVPGLGDAGDLLYGIKHH